MAYTLKNARLRRPAPLSVSSALATRVLSSMRTPSTSAAVTANGASSSKRAATLIAHLHLVSEQRFLEIRLHRVLAQPDAQQRLEKSLAGHRLALRQAVDEERGAAVGGRVVEHDARALLRLPHGADPREEL